MRRCAHEDRPTHARGLCKTCYERVRKKLHKSPPGTTLDAVIEQDKPWRPEATRPSLPRPPRGPDPELHIPEGHELSGLSTHVDADNNPTGAWQKTRVHGADEPPRPAVPEGHHVTRTSTFTRGDGSTIAQWVSAEHDKAAREAAMFAAWGRHAALYAGLAGVAPPAPNPTNDALCTVYPLGDPHIGMLAHELETGENFDTAIAVRDLVGAIRLLVLQSPPSELAIIANLGDFLHAQDDQARTPGHGNQLDVDGRYAKVLDLGHVALRAIVDAALEKHSRVLVRNLPGNHDPRVAVELSYWLRAVYEREPRVEVADAARALQYDRFGLVLIGWAHGDGAKPAELPAIMAADRAGDWGATEERVWHTGHVHHLTRKESPGCVVESHRTMAAKDAWHARRYRAGRSLCAITYHSAWGEVARATATVRRVRDFQKSPSA